MSTVVPPLLPYCTSVLLMDADIVQITRVVHIAHKKLKKKLVCPYPRITTVSKVVGWQRP